MLSAWENRKAARNTLTYLKFLNAAICQKMYFRLSRRALQKLGEKWDGKAWVNRFYTHFAWAFWRTFSYPSVAAHLGAARRAVSLHPSDFQHFSFSLFGFSDSMTKHIPLTSSNPELRSWHLIHNLEPSRKHSVRVHLSQPRCWLCHSLYWPCSWGSHQGPPLCCSM